jgi:glycerol-1-phosphate dehydrogenase [NAD(P)+]
MDSALLERAKRPDLRIGRGILAAAVAELSGSYALISQPQPLLHVDPEIVTRAAATLEADSLDEAHLRDLAARVPAVDHIVGIGGGMVMDAAKFVAWEHRAHLLLAPSIISVDASVTNTIAIRRDGRVEYDGFVVAEPIVADLSLVARAPARLNRAGVGDLLSIQTGRHDWALGAEAGTITFDDAIDAQAGRVLEALYDIADDVAAVTDRALEHIIRAYAAVNTLLLEVGHSGPEEGSEHYFGYAIEAATGRSFVHGELIGLGIVLMSGLQDNAQARAAAFLDRCRVEWRPERLGLDDEVLSRVLADLPRFVRAAGLPHSIIDETTFDQAAIADMLATIPPEPLEDDGTTVTGGQR